MTAFFKERLKEFIDKIPDIFEKEISGIVQNSLETAFGKITIKMDNSDKDIVNPNNIIIKKTTEAINNMKMDAFDLLQILYKQQPIYSSSIPPTSNTLQLPSNTSNTLPILQIKGGRKTRKKKKVVGGEGNDNKSGDNMLSIATNIMIQNLKDIMPDTSQITTKIEKSLTDNIGPALESGFKTLFNELSKNPELKKEFNQRYSDRLQIMLNDPQINNSVLDSIITKTNNQPPLNNTINII